MTAPDRYFRGEARSARCGHGKSDDDIRAIRADPRPVRVIAREQGMSHVMVHFIKTRKRWAHVKDAPCVIG